MAPGKRKKNLPVRKKSSAGKSKLPAKEDGTSKYLAEISKYPLLSKEEEFELARKLYHEKDESAAQKLVTSNLRFVVKIAGEYTKFGLKLLDLIQEGNMGLLIAVKKFNPYRETKLTSYAVWWIRRYIHDYMLRKWSLVKIGTTAAQKKLFYKLRQEQEKLKTYLEYGNAPRLLEHKIIAKNLGVKEKEVAEMEMRMQGGDLSLDAPVGDESDSDKFLDTLKDNTPDAEETLSRNNLRAIFQETLEKYTETLSSRDRYILEKRLIAEDPVNLREIGEKYNISRERVRQLEERIKKNLKDFILKNHPDFEIN